MAIEMSITLTGEHALRVFLVQKKLGLSGPRETLMAALAALIEHPPVKLAIRTPEDDIDF